MRFGVGLIDLIAARNCLRQDNLPCSEYMCPERVLRFLIVRIQLDGLLERDEGLLAITSSVAIPS